MDGNASPGLSVRQAQVAEFIRKYGRTRTASPTVREISESMGASAPQAAQEIVDRLVKKKVLERRPGARGLRIVDEREIPVILAKDRSDPAEPLLTENRIVESVRGVVAETFDPEPDFLALVEQGSGYTQLLAVCQHAEASEGDTVIGRIHDAVVVGKVRGKYIDLEQGSITSEGKARRISDKDFRIGGVVIGTLTARMTARGT